MEFERNEKRTRQISLVPMIDVGFFLLIFFLIGGTIQKFEIIPIEVPVAESGKMLDDGPVNVVLGRYDEILVGDDIVPAEDFTRVLTERLKDNPSKVIMLKADAQLAATKLIAAMERIRTAGGTNISLVTQTIERERETRRLGR